MPNPFAKLKGLTQAAQLDVGKTFEKMAAALNGSKVRGSVQFRLADATNELVFTLKLSQRPPKLQRKAIVKPDLEVIMTTEDWWEIAKGAVSPLEVFARGRVRIRGDYQLGQRILAHLAGTSGRTDLC